MTWATRWRARAYNSYINSSMLRSSSDFFADHQLTLRPKGKGRNLETSKSVNQRPKCFKATIQIKSVSWWSQCCLQSRWSLRARSAHPTLTHRLQMVLPASTFSKATSKTSLSLFRTKWLHSHWLRFRGHGECSLTLGSLQSNFLSWEKVLLVGRDWSINK